MITYNNTREITNKWPGMIVRGENVTPEQAVEILIRTDHNVPFFRYGSNDESLNRELREVFGVSLDCESHQDERARYRTIELSYLDNERITSCWVGGPNGWCDWDGTIGASDKNIGKWPSVVEVAEDWQLIAEAFPYLDLQCQLFDGETCEENAKPVLIFTIKDGNVLVEDSDEPIGQFEDVDYVGFFSKVREQGISVSELREKLKIFHNT